MLDYIISNATIVDGSGNPAYLGCVGIEGGHIAFTGSAGDAQAIHTIDASGRILCPGFIDIHRHGDMAIFRPGFGICELAQGLTTVINGCCGMSAAPICGPFSGDALRFISPVVGSPFTGVDYSSIRSYRSAAASQQLPLNTGILLGMGTLRACIAGFNDTDLTDDEYDHLHKKMERSLSDGALGVSVGLGYAPECFYSKEQLLRALAPLGHSDIVISIHMRQEGDGVVAALDEAIYLARHIKAPLHISHLKSIGSRNWGRLMPQMLNMIDLAREEGLDVTCDVYPYDAGSTQLIHVLPPEFKSGGLKSLLSALADRSSRTSMRHRMETGSDFENISLLVGFENIFATSLRSDKYLELEGHSIADISIAMGCDPYTALFDLLLAEECLPCMIDRITCDEDISRILSKPYSIVISDATYPEGMCHPRVYGHVPKLIETWALKRGALTLEQAVQKLTRLPADRYGLQKKGRIAPGADADLCLFYPYNIHETATYDSPRQLAQGMDAVFVGGKPTILGGSFTGISSGKFI